MPDGDFEKRVVEKYRSDPRVESFLLILEEQVKILVQEGRTNLHIFLTSLESQSIVPSEEVLELQAKFDLESVSHI